MTKDEAAPFAVGDIVETIKGAKFWGKVASVYDLGQPAGWRVDVLAIAPGFEGSLHVYPAVQLALRRSPSIQSGATIKRQVECGYCGWRGTRRYEPNTGGMDRPCPNCGTSRALRWRSSQARPRVAPARAAITKAAAQPDNGESL